MILYNTNLAEDYNIDEIIQSVLVLVRNSLTLTETLKKEGSGKIEN